MGNTCTQCCKALLSTKSVPTVEEEGLAEGAAQEITLVPEEGKNETKEEREGEVTAVANSVLISYLQFKYVR